MGLTLDTENTACYAFLIHHQKEPHMNTDPRFGLFNNDDSFPERPHGGILLPHFAPGLNGNRWSKERRAWHAASDS